MRSSLWREYTEAGLGTRTIFFFFFGTAGVILRLVSRLHEGLRKSPSLHVRCGPSSGPHLPPMPRVHRECRGSLLLLPLNYQVLAESLVFGELFAFVAFIFVYKILITSFIV